MLHTDFSKDKAYSLTDSGADAEKYALQREGELDVVLAAAAEDGDLGFHR